MFYYLNEGIYITLVARLTIVLYIFYVTLCGLKVVQFPFCVLTDLSLSFAPKEEAQFALVDT